MHRRRFQLGIVLACSCLWTSMAAAQDYPSKAIRIVVPFAAAGTSDLVTRVIAGELASSWGVPVTVENRPGAGGNVGSDIVARAPSDGYTLLMGTVATHGINSTLYTKLPFDPVKDFTPVSLVASTPSVFEVNNELPVSSLPELIRYAKEHPGKLHFGSAGNGSSHHLALELFNSMAGTQIVHVPYRGTAAALTDVMSGQIQGTIDTLPSSMSLIKAGKLKVLGVTSLQPVPSLPQAPTVAESGLKGYEVASWYALFLPAGAPRSTVDKLSKTVMQIVQKPEIQNKLHALGALPVGSSDAALAQHVQQEIAKWSVVVRASGAKVD